MTNTSTEIQIMTPISEKADGWGPTFDVTDWSYVDFSDIKDAYVYTQDGKTLLEFPKYVRTVYVQEDIDKLITE